MGSIFIFFFEKSTKKALNIFIDLIKHNFNFLFVINYAVKLIKVGVKRRKGKETFNP